MHDLLREFAMILAIWFNGTGKVERVEAESSGLIIMEYGIREKF